MVQFLGACMLPPHLVMVTEHLPHSLHTVIYNAAIDLDRKRVVALAQDICRALMYLHSRCALPAGWALLGIHKQCPVCVSLGRCVPRHTVGI